MWSGPAAAPSRSVPPGTGLLAGAAPLELLDELLQAASPAAARLAIAMTAIRWERRVMSRLLLAWHGAQAYPWSPYVGTRIAWPCLPGDGKRSRAFMQPQSRCDHRNHSVTIAPESPPMFVMARSGQRSAQCHVDRRFRGRCRRLRKRLLCVITDAAWIGGRVLLVRHAVTVLAVVTGLRAGLPVGEEGLTPF